VRILLSNDDGVLARGLDALRAALEDAGEVFVVAPEREQSGASRSLTLDRPLRVRRVGERVYSVDGTPTDCVLLAVRGIPDMVQVLPDLIVSGINHGANLGDDVTYSGTVAAAAEGSLMGIPSLAVSLASWEPTHFESAARVARVIVDQVRERPLPAGTLLNVNVPDLPFEELRGTRVTHLGRRFYPDKIVAQLDPRGKPCYWIGGETPTWLPGEGNDFEAVEAGFVSVTPLHLDLTDHALLGRVAGWSLGPGPKSGPGAGSGPGPRP
jgi:5'-nucleotidase